jgi:hypothetical protein
MAADQLLSDNCPTDMGNLCINARFVNDLSACSSVTLQQMLEAFLNSLCDALVAAKSMQVL